LSTKKEKHIVISPIGKFDPALLRNIERKIFDDIGLSAGVLSLLDSVEFARDTERDQYYSTAILEKLTPLVPAETLKVVALTSVDLFIPILTHVYGEARIGGNVCVVSDFRLKESRSTSYPDQLTNNRIVKEAFHELGHTFGLLHCKDRSCIMHYCRQVKDVDRKSEQLCRYCQILLKDEIRRLGLD
jgi:archaemetzincin